MSRLMSVAHTEAAVRNRAKTVTRRLGWAFLKPGDRLTLCRKVMGRKPGEPLERIAEVEVVSVRREPLEAMTAMSPAELDAEGVPYEVYATEEHERSCFQCRAVSWVDWFARTMGCRSWTEVTRIEWRYL